LGADSAVFGEAHGEFINFWKTIQRLFRNDSTITSQSGFNERTDLSFGGGYRTLLNENTLLGVNGFFDTTKLGSRWYSSGGLGIEYAALLPGNGAFDLTFNWYGNLFSSNVLANAFRRGPENYDFQAGYSHELWNGGPDLRLSATGYRFTSGSGVYGGRAGAELKTRDGMFSLKYEAAYDRVNKTYHTVGGFVNVGIRMSNLLNGESPLEMPAPIFRSPRNIRRRLTDVVRRQWYGAAPPTATTRIPGVGPGCPTNACPFNPTTPILQGELQLYAPTTMTSGQTMCVDIPDVTLGGTTISVFVTRTGTNGTTVLGPDITTDVCALPMVLSAVVSDGATSACPTGGPIPPATVVHSILVNCVSAGGCSAGCINVQLWHD
jgi:hypothetical protein